jgi:hypothetical protein
MAGCGGLSRLIGWKGFGHRLTNVFGPMLIYPWARSLMVNSRCGKSNQKKGKAASFLAMQGGCMMSTHGHEQWSFPFRTPAVRWRPSTCPSVGVRRRARRHYFSRWLPFGPARGHVNGHSGAPGVSGMWEGRGTAAACGKGGVRPRHVGREGYGVLADSLPSRSGIIDDACLNYCPAGRWDPFPFPYSRRRPNSAQISGGRKGVTFFKQRARRRRRSRKGRYHMIYPPATRQWEERGDGKAGSRSRCCLSSSTREGEATNTVNRPCFCFPQGIGPRLK